MTDTADNPPSASASPAAAAAVPPLPPGRWVPDDPGRVLGIVGFALSFVFPINIVGLILSIVGMVKSRRVRIFNRFALAGIIISSIGIAFCTVIIAILASTLISAAITCSQLGTGVHVVGNSTYTCTPTSFYVQTHP